MKPDPEHFAAQVNHLAALGRLIVPRAFAFMGRRVLFVGHEPFDAEELGGLLPDGADWYEQQYAPKDFAPDIVVLGRTFPKSLVKSVLADIEGYPKVIPQEGFLDELLFGHDWWSGKLESLREMTNGHPGLQSAKAVGALHPVGIGVPEPVRKKSPVVRDRLAPVKRPKVSDPPIGAAKPAATFTWPSTEAEETKGAGDSELDLLPESRLRQLGYTTNEPRSVRWRILTTSAVPELGLPKVASMIAWFCRSRKQQKGGRQKFARAIAEWEHDLDRLKREVYPNHRPQFVWPRSEP
jgi:hypothetical protein